MIENKGDIPKWVLFTVAICSVLLLTDPHSSLTTIALISASLLLMPYPVAFIPLIMVSSVSSSITVVPGLAAIFYYIPLYLLSCIIRKKRKVRIKNFLPLIFVFAFWLLVSSYNSVSGETALALRMLIAIIPLAFGALFIMNLRDLNKLMVITAIFSSIYIIAKLIYSPILYSTGDELVMTSVNSGLTIAKEINQNTLAQFLLINYLIVFVSAIEQKKNLLFLFCLPQLSSMLLTGSRTIFLSAIIISLIVFILSTSISKTKKIALILVILFLGSSIMGFIVQTNSRMAFDTIIEDRGSGRFDTWEKLFQYTIPDNLLLGIGFGRENYTRLGYLVDGDNLYVDILTQLGLVGLIIFFYLLFTIFFNLRKIKTPYSKVAQSLILFILLGGIGETMFDSFLCWYVIFFCAITIVGSKFIGNQFIKG